MIKTKKQMYTVIGAFLLVMLLTTVTYAFFNYTRTGVANNIRTGRIFFNSTQNGTLNLTNVFPVASNEMDSSNQIEVRIWGDTTYTGGEEFEVSLVSVNNTIVSGSTEKTIPISYIASYTGTPVATGETPNNIGTSSNDYFTNRGSTTAVYQLKTTGTASEGEQVLIGYIPKDVAVDGTLTIKAYIDSSNISISDTYDEASPETDYNGTTTNWVNGRTVLTTDEWNTLQNTPISFKVKVVTNEGTWVEEPVVTATDYILSNVQSLETTPYGKIYVGVDPDNYVIFNNEQWRIIGVYGNNLKIVRATPISYQTYNSSSDDGNIWEESRLKEYLNQSTSGGYYYGLSLSAKEMIEENGVWNVGAVSSNANSHEAYLSASTTNVYNSQTYTTPWVGKIGTVASYEYLYAAGEECRETSGYWKIFNTCGQNDWLRSSSSFIWTLSPSSTYNEKTILVYPDGYVADDYVTGSYGVYPSVYLKSGVTITGGTGASSGNEYILNYLDN